MEKVKIVIPVYTEFLQEKESKSLLRTAQVLGRYPVVLVTPHGVDVQAVAGMFPACEVLRVGDEWLGTKNGIAGYNRMMLSREFYELFLDTEYILICQPDAWIFRDELLSWCDRGYDYAGAPIPRRRLYGLLPVRGYLAIRRRLCRGLLRQDVLGKVFNGGLSLRRVETFRHACETYRMEIADYLSHHHHLYNEDVFWSLVPGEFVRPGVKEAVRFAFDVKPDYCYRLAGCRLPFGCHGWFLKSRIAFWSRFIE